MLLAGPVSAQAPPPEPDFSPPPVPDFMLRKPDKPLTLEEMKRQADEAAARVRAGTRMPMPPAPPATAPTSKGDEAAAK